MRRSTKPNVPVVLSDMEIHWLITRHDHNIKESMDTTLGYGKEWSEQRKGALLAEWDQAKQASQDGTGRKARRPTQASGESD